MKKILQNKALHNLLAAILMMSFTIFSAKAQVESSSDNSSDIRSVNFADNSTVLSHSNSDETSLNVYPNPANDEAKLAFNSAQYDQRYEVRIVNASGMELKNIEGTTSQGTNTIDIHVGDYPPGVYYVQLLTTTGRETLKLLKQPMNSF